MTTSGTFRIAVSALILLFGISQQQVCGQNASSAVDLNKVGGRKWSVQAEDSVKAVVNNLFTGMKTGDAAMILGCFDDSAILQTITRNKEGKVVIRNEQVAAFADFVSKQPKGAADERIVFETIRIDRAMAIAWTPYQFYYNGAFSHCGVNMFQLVNFNGLWKIHFLIDTRRKEPCD